ncbi:MAG TPA: hypothetical protein VK656_02050 [Candidatus Acidoferrum sp.]|nr:hypothetical protein [Candidatus Acidoferrum sp.]
MLNRTLRLGVGVVSAFIFVFGILLIVSATSPISGLWCLIVGGAGIVVATLERGRYRSEYAERSDAPAGPGGGETDDRLESRFQRTTEVFVDPTSGRRMRVWIDPGSGERRYRAEG